MSVIVRTNRSPLQEVVSHTRQDVKRQGRAVIRLEEVADPGRFDVGGEADFLEVLRRRSVLDRQPSSGLPLMSRRHGRMWYCRGVNQRLNNYASPQAAQGRIIFTHIRQAALRAHAP